MREAHDAWFFIGVFVFIFIFWIFIGGPTHPIAFTGPSLSQPSPIGGGTYLQLPRASFGIGNSEVSLPGSSDGAGSTNNTSVPNGSIETQTPPPLDGVIFGLSSPYRNNISLSNYVSSASSTNEYVEISVAQNASAPINITKWVLESEATYNAEIIPKGTNVPTSGVVNATQDIILQPGERAIINSGESPVGASFRENKCTGYFNTFQKFSPSLPQNCPLASKELSSSYGVPYIHDPDCIDYANSLSRCQIPLAKAVNLNDTCQSFLIKYLNYNGCVAAHKNDSDFNGNTWRIYLGRTTPMWRTKHEVVKLLDERGKTVAMFSY